MHDYTMHSWATLASEWWAHLQELEHSTAGFYWFSWIVVPTEKSPDGSYVGWPTFRCQENDWNTCFYISVSFAWNSRVLTSLPSIKATEGFCKFPLQNQTQIFKTCFLSALFFYVSVSLIDFPSIWQNPPTTSLICRFFPWIASWLGRFWLRKAQESKTQTLKSEAPWSIRKESLCPNFLFLWFFEI